MELLLEKEEFSHDIWEPAVGAGHLAQVLKEHGHNVFCSDIINRGYPDTYTIDFLNCELRECDMDIITNPPFKYAKEFVEQALDRITDRHKVAMFLKLQFLEGKSRRKLFETAPPQGFMLQVADLIARQMGTLRTRVAH